MSDRLPSLTALRAFEAAARHLSFARAADELFVTPAALSYQIKSLEADLGMPLFRRFNRAVELTEAGKALAPAMSTGFEALSAGWRQVRRLCDSAVLTVTAGPAFTSKWLAPRMYDFAQRHPEIELRFLATLRIVDFARDDVDVAIRFGTDVEEGMHSRSLGREWVTPMMSPELASKITAPQDLAKAPLIHDDSTSFLKSPVNWPAWADVFGLDLETSQGPRFSQSDHALDAAIAGAGVVLGRVSLAAASLDSGQLVAPFPSGMVTEAQFRFLCPEGMQDRPPIRAFSDWVAGEIAAREKYEDGRVLVDSSGAVAK